MVLNMTSSASWSFYTNMSLVKNWPTKIFRVFEKIFIPVKIWRSGPLNGSAPERKGRLTAWFNLTINATGKGLTRYVQSKWIWEFDAKKISTHQFDFFCTSTCTSRPIRSRDLQKVEVERSKYRKCRTDAYARK